MPAISGEAGRNVLREAHVGATGERDVVLVVEVNQLAQAKMSRERGRLLSNTFHQIAIATDGVRVVINDFVAWPVIASGEPGFCNGHADAIAKALPQRTG